MKQLFENKKHADDFVKKYDEIDRYINYYQKLKSSIIISESYYGDGVIEDFEQKSLMCFSEYPIGCGDYERSYFTIPYSHLYLTESQLIEIFKKEQAQIEKRDDIQNRWNIRNVKMKRINTEAKQKERDYKTYLELKEQFENISN